MLKDIIESKLRCINNRLDEIDNLKDFSENPKFLFHYTDACTGLSILKNREVWMTNYLDLNDKQELKLPDQIIDDLSNNKFQHHGVFQHYKKKYFSLRNEYKVFTLSFCETDNNEDLWSKYGTNKEGCIIKLKFPPNFDININCKFVPMKVVYSNESRFSNFKEEMSDLITMCFNESDEVNLSKNFALIVTCMLANAPRFKRVEYQKEKEFRLYLHDVSPGFSAKNIPRQIITNIGGKERCILKLTQNNIVQVIPGSKCKISELLKQYNNSSINNN